jgi:hypothetical protein
MTEGRNGEMDSYETLARRGAAAAESSIEEYDRRFWTTYALGMSMLASVEVERTSVESRTYRETVLQEVERWNAR